MIMEESPTKLKFMALQMTTRQTGTPIRASLRSRSPCFEQMRRGHCWKIELSFPGLKPSRGGREGEEGKEAVGLERQR